MSIASITADTIDELDANLIEIGFFEVGKVLNAVVGAVCFFAFFFVFGAVFGRFGAWLCVTLLGLSVFVFFVAFVMRRNTEVVMPIMTFGFKIAYAGASLVLGSGLAIFAEHTLHQLVLYSYS